MLKWAVNGPRQTYTQNENNKFELPINAKSSDEDVLRPKSSSQDKENQYTSTPLHTSSRSFCDSPSRKMDCLKDLSNIVPEILYNSPMRQTSNRNSPNIFKTPEILPVGKNLPNNYATTLPTFDVEYSPCSLIPGPLLALRGIGIPDSYFEKPRYITPHLKENLNTPLDVNVEETKSPKNQNINTQKYPLYVEESTLSSTKMGDATLERMIDAILESNRKERKPLKLQKPAQQAANMSPTYTPAEDPASDLHEIWDSEKARYRQKQQKFRARLTKKSLFNEADACSPQFQETLVDAGRLRRQRGVRRKRKITQITASVMNSAQKLLGKNLQDQKPFFHPRNLRKVFEADLIQDEIHPRKLMRNLSPDSGHHSSSDYEEEENDSTLECMTNDNKTPDVTKRRLRFSLQNLN